MRIQIQGMKFLLHSHFPAGHAYPMQAVAQALVDGGHEVVWLTSADNETRVRATGAAFVATNHIASIDATLVLENATGLLDGDYYRHRSRLLAQAADYRAVLTDFPADALLVDVLPYGARALYELGEIPVYATLGVIPLYTSIAIAPLPVSGKFPPTSWLGIFINWCRHTVNQWLVLPLRLRPILNRQRSTLGLPSLPYGEPAECFTYSRELHIQGSSPTLEFCQKPKLKRHRDNLVYVGPLVAPQKTTVTNLPDWWQRVVAHTRVIGITQGTLAMDPDSLIIPSILALCDDSSILMIVVSPHVNEIEARVGKHNNVCYARWLPYHILLPQLSLLITNGGYGSITQALSHGIPLICAGQTEDKKDTAARVTWSGAGIDLKTDSPATHQIREATTCILTENKYGIKARQLGDELNRLGGARKAREWLEILASKYCMSTTR